jgi:hypothetical protein
MVVQLGLPLVIIRIVKWGYNQGSTICMCIAGTRANRLDGLRKSGWKPINKEEAAVFLAHVFHETGGLKIISEYNAPG